ncbi:MAG: hypothetical protein IBJ08_02530 [Pseudomonas sp.]|nr:hypothetical protein [Pseudomonas sp.]
MVSIPTFTSRIFSDPATSKTLRATEIEAQQWTVIDELTKEEITVESSNLQISEQAYAQLEMDRQVQAIKSRQNHTGQAVITRSEAIDVPASVEIGPDRLATESHQDKIKRVIDEYFGYGAVDRGIAEVYSSTETLEQTYDNLMAQINQLRPSLGNSSFGFSVNEEGRIVILDPKDLKDEEIDYLEKALNSSQALVNDAIAVANAHIALANAQPWTRGLELNRQNYTQTIDIGADLLYRRQAESLPRGTDKIPTNPVDMSNYWRTQLDLKGRSSTAG